MHAAARGIATLAGAALLIAAPGSLPGQETRQRPVFAARELLPENLLSGEDFSLDPAVRLVGHHYEFKIVTRWGTLPARGMNMLHLRLHELRAIEQARKKRWEPKELEGAFRTLRRTPEGALMILADPLGTVFRTPRNLQRLVAPAINEQDRRAGTDVRRRLADELGCDPETNNPILKALLDQLSLREKVGNLAGKIGLSAAVPGLGLLSLNADMHNDVVNKLPSEINAGLNTELAKLGVSETLRRQFLENRAFTTTERLVFMAQLRKLQEVPGAITLLENAASARDETQALAVLEENVLLIGFLEQHPRPTVRFIGLPAAVLDDGAAAVFASVDLLAVGPELDELAAAIRRHFPEPTVTLFVAGRVTAPAREALSRSKIAVADGLRAPLTPPDGAERGK